MTGNIAHSSSVKQGSARKKGQTPVCPSLISAVSVFDLVPGEDLESPGRKLSLGGGGVIDPLPADAPQFVKDYYDYYKTPRGYHERSLNSNDGWNQTGCISFMNQPILKYTKEIRSAVLIVHGSEAHSRYFAEDAYRDMTSYTNYRDNKELMIIPGATHCDLYDGGKDKVIPWDKLEAFFKANLK